MRSLEEKMKFWSNSKTSDFFHHFRLKIKHGLLLFFEMKKHLIFLVVIFVFTAFNGLQSQILHTENFSVILDTTQHVKGNILPSLRYRNVQKDFLEIENMADISVRIGRQGFTVSNKLEYAIFGAQEIMSGGWIYLEYQNTIDKKHLVLEPYALLMWQEVRGIRQKYAIGSNLRFEWIAKKDFGLYTGVGVFFEDELWNYNGVRDVELIPEISPDVRVQQMRGALYLSLKKEFEKTISIDLSAYYQPTFSNLQDYRLASSTEVVYHVSSHLGLSLMYQNIYDSKAPVPIDALFNDLQLGVSLLF